MNTPSEIPLSRSKVILPRRRDELLSRPRLLQLLNRFLDKKLILISAPAGYGKTSLLIDLASNSELPVCWLSLDELDREPQRFLAYFVAAIAERFPSFGKQSSSMLNSTVSLAPALEQLSVTLTNEIYENIREHFVLVLDDYHLVDNVPAIRDFIGRFLKLSDENCHLILSSRLLVPLPELPRMVAHEEVEGLDFSELAFRPEEIQALLRHTRGAAISDAAARELAEQSEGWITGLQLTSFGKDPSAQVHLSRLTGVNLDSYFEQQVLSRQPSILHTALLYTSLFDEFDAELCQAALDELFPEPQDWPSILNAILLNNLFVLPVGADGHWLRYHHLFRDFLRSRLNAKYPQRSAEIQARLVHAYEMRGEWERAYYTCRQFNRPEQLAEVVERAGPTMLRRAVPTLTDWLNAIPPAFSNSRPGLLSLRGGIGYLHGNHTEALTLLNEAERLYRQNGDSAGLALALVRRATAQRNLGEYTASLRDSEEALQLTGNDASLLSVHAEAERVKGLSLYRLGQNRRAIESLERSLALYAQSHQTDSVPILTMNCGMVYRALGNYEAAERYYLKALETWRAEGNIPWQATLLNNLGTLYQTLGEYEKASLSLQEGLNCARKSRYLQSEAWLSTALGELYVELEEYEGAEQAFEQAEALVRGTSERSLLNYLALIRAWLALAQNEIKKAEQFLTNVRSFINESASYSEMGLWLFYKGCLTLMVGDASASTAYLKQAEAIFLESGRELELMWSRVWLAAALTSAGDAGVEEKLKALIHGQSPLPHALIVAFRQARPWLEKVRTDPHLGRQLRLLFQRADQFDERLPVLRRALRRLPQSVALSAPQLVIRALGWSHVTVNARPVEWQTQSVCELFFYFLTAEKPVSKEQVAEAMWGDVEDPNRLRQRFKNELYRLRRAVGSEVIVLEGELYRFNRALDYDYDVDDFETCLARARAAKSQDEQIANLERAVGLVKGQYLADVGAAWAMLDRESLQLKFTDAAILLANLCWARGNLEKTADACQRILDLDPAWEAAHQLMMRVHTARGDRVAVVRQYKACKDALARLDLLPSEETERLYRELSS